MNHVRSGGQRPPFASQRLATGIVWDNVREKFYPVPAGGAESDEGPSSSGEETGSDETEEDKNKTRGQETEETEETTSSGEASGGTVSQQEYEKLKKRMQAADRRASDKDSEIEELRDKVEKYEREKRSDLENAQEDLEEAQNRVASLEEENSNLRMRLAVLRSKDASRFHDPDDILKNLDFSQLEHEENGDIDEEALSESLNSLAESKPHLVSETEDENDDDKNNTSPPSGRLNQSGSSGDGLDRQTLERKYPALRGRGRL